MDQLLFTPASVLDLLSKIDELKDVDVGVVETLDGKLQVQVGQSVYEIDDSNSTDVSVDEQTFDTVDDANLDAYDSLESSGEIELKQPVESGILKQIAKTLLIGGLVRLSKKLLS